jgi:hypothetical protein
MYSGRVSSSCFTVETSRASLLKQLLINNEEEMLGLLLRQTEHTRDAHGHRNVI